MQAALLPVGWIRLLPGRVLEGVLLFAELMWPQTVLRGLGGLAFALDASLFTHDRPLVRNPCPSRRLGPSLIRSAPEGHGPQVDAWRSAPRSGALDVHDDLVVGDVHGVDLDVGASEADGAADASAAPPVARSSVFGTIRPALVRTGGGVV